MDKGRKKKLKNKYRDKVSNEKEYRQQLLVKSKYLSTERMRRVYHQFCNNKTEQIHGLVVNVFLPKRSYFCRTICGKARTYLAVSVDSLGFEEYFLKLYLELGITMSNVTRLFYKQHDKKRRADAIYAKTAARRKKRATRKLELINTAWQQEVGDKANGHTYQSRLTCPRVVATSTTTTVDTMVNSVVVVATAKLCLACGNSGHQRRTSKLCVKNPRSPHYEGTCVLVF